MVINYQLGKVYKIVGNGHVYVGSTCEKYLSNRLAGHNRDFRKFQKGYLKGALTSYKCLSDENHYIELLELFPCNSKDELHTCERKWIEQLDCVNKIIPNRTDMEKSEYHKQYNQNNRDKINEQKRKTDKIYRQNNRDKINERKRNWRKAKKAITE